MMELSDFFGIGGGSDVIVDNGDGSYTIDGTLIVTGDITALSDESVKINVVKVTSALDMVTQMEGVYFYMENGDRRHVGVIAQEMEKVLPEVIHQVNGVKSVAYGNITAVLIEAIKDLKAEIELLKSK